MESLNVCAGIDAGKSVVKLGYADDLGTRIIARSESSDMNEIREEAEIFFDAPVFSCVIAAPESYSSKQKRELILNANAAGFRDVSIISSYEAIILALDIKPRVLVYDFGASKSDIAVLEGEKVIDCEVIQDICGNEFDKIFAEYLSELISVFSIENNNILREAKRIKHFLTDDIKIDWHEYKIFREDFEKLIHFSVKRAAHIVERLVRIHKPERFILTGGCANIPEVQKIFDSEIKIKAEIHEDIITKGAAIKARSISKEKRRAADIKSTAERIKELRAGIIELEEKLTRPQKDRLYILFRNAEGINDAGIVNIMENLIRDIKNSR